MSAEVRRIEILEVELPFRRVFRHALSIRRSSNSIFLRIVFENGTTGYGEALPREYVTDETTKSVTKRLLEILPRKVLRVKFSNFRKGAEFISRLNVLESAAKCCVDIALLDGLGKYFNKPLFSIIGRPVRNVLYSSGVISAGSLPFMTKSAMEIKAFGFKTVKVKVGVGSDSVRLNIARSILGDSVDIRIDANCAWNAEDAVEKIAQLRKFGISAIEQPVKSYDIRGFKKVYDNVPEAIIADESLSSVKDAERFAKIKACDMFNIRLSKCGGIVNSIKINEIAARNSIRCQVGCQVGESGILTAAGMHFACCVKNLEYYEGAYGRFLLKEDVTKENLTFGRGGRISCPVGPGLGITVRDDILNKYTVNKFVVE